MNSNREKITNIVMVGVFAAVLAVLSQISFPLPSTAQLRPPFSKSTEASVKMPQTFFSLR